MDVLKGLQSSRTQQGQTVQQAAQQQARQQAAQQAVQQTAANKLPADIAAQVPPDFDWSTYLLYHPELREQEHVQTEDDAKLHYVEKGRAEGRFYKRLRVLLRYTACTGLINQQYSHIAAFSLSAVLGAELVLAPAVKRDSFANYFSTFKDQNEVSWTAAPLSSLLDVESIIHFWQQRGLVVHNVSLCCWPGCLSTSWHDRTERQWRAWLSAVDVAHPLQANSVLHVQLARHAAAPHAAAVGHRTALACPDHPLRPWCRMLGCEPRPAAHLCSTGVPQPPLLRRLTPASPLSGPAVFPSPNPHTTPSAPPQHSASKPRPDLASLQTPALTPFPDLTQPEVAFPLYPHPEIDPRLVTHLDNVYLQNLDMPELIEKARVAVIGHATALLKAEPQRNVDYVVLDLPCTFFMLRSLRWGLGLEGAGSLGRARVKLLQLRLLGCRNVSSLVDNRLRLGKQLACAHASPSPGRACCDVIPKLLYSL